MHTVGFDAAGESIELKITARDRSAYFAGALLAADWLVREGSNRPVGLYPFDAVVRTLIDDSPGARAGADNGSTPVMEETHVLAG